MRVAAKQKRRRIRRTFPLFGLLLYYAGLVGAASVLIAFVPGFREALVAPFAEPPRSQVDELLTGGHPVVTGPPMPWPGLGGRGILALTAMSWTLAVALPVAWVLMRTRRLRYDPSLREAHPARCVDFQCGFGAIQTKKPAVRRAKSL